MCSGVRHAFRDHFGRARCAAGQRQMRVMSVDLNKGLIAEMARGRDLAIAGDFKPALSLTPAVVVDNVSLANWGRRSHSMKTDPFPPKSRRPQIETPTARSGAVAR